MHRRIRLAFVTAVTAVATMLALSRPGGTTEAAPPGRVIPDQYVVVLTDAARGTSGPGRDPLTVADEHARVYGAAVSHVYDAALRGYAARIPAARLAQLRADPAVLFITADREAQLAVTTAPLARGDSAPTGVRRIAAATTSTVRVASTAAVAVLDTGIDLRHRDLAVTSGVNCITKSARAQDDHGHGTHVAGTIAARNNGSGVVGVAPGTPLYAVKVMDRSGGTLASVLCGIDWITKSARQYNIMVANMSFVFPGWGGDDLLTPTESCAAATDALRKALCASTAAGVTYVAAAGNDRTDLTTNAPASYPETVAATAMVDVDGAAGGTNPACGPEEAPASFSNFAAAAADRVVAAPGGCISSTALGGGYTTMSGTSMAAPHVAGVVALCRAAGSCRGTAAMIGQLIRTTEDAHGFTGDARASQDGKYYGYLVWAGDRW